MRLLAKQVLRHPRLCLALVVGVAVVAILAKATVLSGDLSYRAGDFEVKGSTSREVGDLLATTSGLGDVPDVSILYPRRREAKVRAELDEVATISAVGFQSRSADQRVLFGFLDQPGPAPAEELARSLQRIRGTYVAGPEIERQQGAARISRRP